MVRGGEEESSKESSNTSGLKKNRLPNPKPTPSHRVQNTSPAPSSSNQSCWVGVIVPSSKKHRKYADAHVRGAQPSKFQATCQHCQKPAIEKVKVMGIQKVWGSLRSCTAKTMATTTAKLCPTMADEIQLRRKYKCSQDGQVVVHHS